MTLLSHFCHTCMELVTLIHGNPSKCRQCLQSYIEIANENDLETLIDPSVEITGGLLRETIGSD